MPFTIYFPKEYVDFHTHQVDELRLDSFSTSGLLTVFQTCMVLSHLYPVVEIVFFTWKVLLSFLSVKIGLESLRKSCLWKEKGHLPLREKEEKGRK